MRKALLVALLLSLSGNAYLGALLIDQGNTIDAALHIEAVSEFGLRDLSYFLRKCDPSPSQLLEWAHEQPSQPGVVRARPKREESRFVWFPLEVTFGEAGTVERIEVGGNAY